ncbi:hypothetical protein J8273_7776 [Carpediemonas membranifera]|uniref:Uncharacterized protein n=1 Tax=Carpediemonas membranifera TaxID=201153 RepID=A0A8J6BUJ7_9EUKA|nr:hypothetical protein J8273_7776 [Carpediemonas membranifera]|eukprot:KAG9390426.1 hypothetical protein J8273_7776 [Carpediemonas membranifera]
MNDFRRLEYRTDANKAEMVVQFTLLGHSPAEIAGMLRMRKKDVKLIVELHQNPQLRLNLERLRAEEEETARTARSEAASARSDRTNTDLDTVRQFKTRYGFKIDVVKSEVTKEESILIETELKSLSFSFDDIEWAGRANRANRRLSFAARPVTDREVGVDSSSFDKVTDSAITEHDDYTEYTVHTDVDLAAVSFEAVEDAPTEQPPTEAGRGSHDRFDSIFPQKKIPSYRWDLKIRRKIERLLIRLIDRILGIDMMV